MHYEVFFSLLLLPRKDWGKQRKVSVRIAGLRVENRNRNLPNASHPAEFCSSRPEYQLFCLVLKWLSSSPLHKLYVSFLNIDGCAFLAHEHVDYICTERPNSLSRTLLVPLFLIPHLGTYEPETEYGCEPRDHEGNEERWLSSGL
jgi:hypothetical protein